MASTRIVITGPIHLVTDRLSQPAEAWLLIPNATDPVSVSIALGLSGNVVAFHEPRLVLNRDQLDDPAAYPNDLFQTGLACHPAGWSYVDLRNRHLDIGENLSDVGLAADRTPLASADNESSVLWLGDLDELIATGDQVTSAPLHDDLFVESYPPQARLYPPMVARSRIHTGRLEAGELFRNSAGDPLETGFFNSTHPQRSLARELVVSYADAAPEIKVRTLDRPNDPAVTLRWKPDVDIEIRIENAGPCNGDEQNDFLAHYLLRQWPAGNGFYPYPKAGGRPGNNPQCSPTEGTGP